MVDLSIATEGVLERAGKKWFCLEIEPERDGVYSVRIEHGWKSLYKQDGSPVIAGRLPITSIEPMTYAEAKARYPGIETETVP